MTYFRNRRWQAAESTGFCQTMLQPVETHLRLQVWLRLHRVARVWIVSGTRGKTDYKDSVPEVSLAKDTAEREVDIVVGTFPFAWHLEDCVRRRKRGMLERCASLIVFTAGITRR
jgi:hypothetical protein